MNGEAKMNLKFPVAAALAGLLAACASYGPTPYQPAGGSDMGYSDTRIESDRFRVSFRGNSLTDRETVENYLLYRAAELTLQNGYDHFTIADRDTDRDRQIRSSGPSYYGSRLDYLYFHPRHGWIGAYSPVWGPSTYREVTRYEASAEIVLGRGPKSSDANAFDAREVSKNLAGSVARPAQ